MRFWLRTCAQRLLAEEDHTVQARLLDAADKSLRVSALLEWAQHYNQGRPHKELGPGVPAPIRPIAPLFPDRHLISSGLRVHTRPVLGGLRPEYSLEKMAA